MKPKLRGFFQRYQTALRAHLKQGRQAGFRRARELGRQAATNGLETLHLARIHEQVLSTLHLSEHAPDALDALIRQAATFFAETITPIEENHRTALEAGLHLGRMHDSLSERTAALALSNRRLKEEIRQRKAVERCLRNSERHSTRLLEQSRRMHDQLRLLSRQLLSVQEEERKRISRELHDVIAQTLAGINVRLGALKKEAALNTAGLEQSISHTQQLVQQSVDIVHRFARELRPTVLDDLGLVPALHTFMKTFREQTGLQVSLSAFAGVQHVNSEKRTMLFRVAQEALNNVASHAQAGEVKVKISKLDGAICMSIKDDGKGFHPERLPRGKKNKRLGLLGMRERLEMVGGSFMVTSAPGKGTTVQARVPYGHGAQVKNLQRPPANARI